MSLQHQRSSNLCASTQAAPYVDAQKPARESSLISDLQAVRDSPVSGKRSVFLPASIVIEPWRRGLAPTPSAMA